MPSYDDSPRRPRSNSRPSNADNPRSNRPRGERRELAAVNTGEERIARVLARVGLCSRREAEQWIEEGRVSVNGKVLTSPALNVTEEDKVVVDGKPLPSRDKTRLWLYHKPKGLVSTNFDPEGRPTIFDHLDPDLPRLMSIGRLDINTEGLLLLTNDGGLARALSHPTTGWLRKYRVRAYGEIGEGDIAKLRRGLSVDGIDYAPIDAELEREQGSNVWLTLGLREGKNREVKNVLGSLGLDVNRLIRVSFGPFQLGDILEGQVEEVRTKVLKEQLGEEIAAIAGATFDTPEGADANPLKRIFGNRTRTWRDDEAGQATAAHRPRGYKGGKRDEFEGDFTQDAPVKTEDGDVAVERRAFDPTGKSEETKATRFGKPEREWTERPPQREWTERPPRRDFSDKPRGDFGDRPPRKDFGDRPARPAFGDRPPRRDFNDKPRGDFGDRPPRKDFGDRPARPAFGDRPPRRDFNDKPRGDFGDRPPRKDFGDRPARPAFGDRPPRRDFNDKPRGDFGDRPPRKDFGDRPARPAFGDRPPRRDFNDKPRGDFGDRPPRKDFGDRPARPAFGDRPPRRDFSDKPRGDFGDRPPRKDFGDRPARPSFGDRPPRRDFNDKPRGDFGDRPPRKDFGDRPARPAFGDRPPRREFNDRPPRDFGDRPARPAFGDRPARPAGAGRPAGGGGRPPFGGGRPGGGGRPSGGRPSGGGGFNRSR